MDYEMEGKVQQEIEERVREGVKALFEQILEEEMDQHLGAGRYQRTSSRRGERNGRYKRALLSGVGQIRQLQVPRDREGSFRTELFERYRRLTGSVEEAVLEMYLQGVSTRKVAAVTEALSGKRVGKDAVSRITRQLQEQVQVWKERALEEEYPYLYLDATYLKANWGGKVVSVALLVAVGVSESGYRELLAVEVAVGEKAVAYQGLLRGLLDRGLRGVRLVISDDHEGIKAAVEAELPRAKWQRCVVHFERNVLGQVPAQAQAEVAGDLKEVFAVSRRETAEALAEAFMARWVKKFPKAIAVFERGIEEALVYLDFPREHHRRVRTTNGLERLFQEIKRRTRVIGVFPNEGSLTILTTAVGMRVTEEWAMRRYLTMELLDAQDRVQQGTSKIPQLSRR
jgi:putative transposase